MKSTKTAADTRSTITLTGRVALVTGVGRYQGLGAAMCRALAEHGVNVFFTYWHAYDGELFPEDNQINPTSFQESLAAHGVRAAFAEVDLSRAASTTELLQTVTEKLGAPTIIINNACYDIAGPFSELNERVLDQHYAVNVRATTMLCREFVKLGRPGSIINMTSGQSLGHMGADKVAYTITKASAEMLAQQLAPDLIASGITINALDPGPIDTGWMSDQVRSAILKTSKRGRLSTPTDIAELVIEILSNGQ